MRKDEEILKMNRRRWMAALFRRLRLIRIVQPAYHALPDGSVEAHPALAAAAGPMKEKEMHEILP
jgi:hypothetical protein